MKMNKYTHRIFLLALFLVALAAPKAHADTLPATYSNNQLCPQGGYNCSYTSPQQATSSSRTVFTRNLGVGSQGTDVYSLQIYLNSEGLFFGPFTGYFGTKTQQALISLQQKFAIPPTGYFGIISRTFVQGALSDR